MGHIVLDLTSLMYQPPTKSSDRLGNPKRHETFTISERKPAFPAHTQPISEDEDDGPLVQPHHAVVFDDDQPFVRPATRRVPSEIRRDQTTDNGDLAPLVPPRPSPVAPLRRRKGHPVWQDPTATLEQEVTRNSRERTAEVSILSKNSDGEALQNIINKLSDERNLKGLHLKHYHMSTAQFKQKATHLDIPGKVYDIYQHVVKTCPFCNSIKPRPERSRENCENSEVILSSLLMLTRLDLLGSSCCLMRIAHRSSCVHLRPLLCQSAVRPHTSCCLGTRVPVSSQTTIDSRSHLIGPWIGNDWRQNLWISDCSGWRYITFDSISMQVTSHLKGS